MSKCKKVLTVGVVAASISIPTAVGININNEKMEIQQTLNNERIEYKAQLQEHEQKASELLKQMDEQLNEINSLAKSNKELTSKNNELEGVRYLISNNCGGYTFKAGDIELLQKLVEAEAGNEPFEGKIAVANVVMNRMKSPKYPDTLEGVIYAKNQFQPVGSGVIYTMNPSPSTKKAVEMALKGEKVIPDDVVSFWATWLNKDHVMWGHLTPVLTIGSHHFAKGWDE